MPLPRSIADIAQLETLLSEPSPAVIEMVRELEGDYLVLGVAGKMGPTLARMLKRAVDAAGVKRRVIGVSRFSATQQEASLQAHGVETIRCDLLDESAFAALPEVRNVIYMAGMKFGSTGQESFTWAMNTHLPAMVAKQYRRSRIVAFSTGNVYGLSAVEAGGSREGDAPAPVGEYAMSCLGRERMFEYFSQRYETPTALIRLNYACEMRYGVLVDLARRIWSGQPVDVSMGYLNTLWQGDANALSVLALDHVAAPPMLLNLTGPELLSVREVSGELARLMGKPVSFVGEEADNALLNNSTKAFELLGRPQVSAEQLIAWVADWVMRDGASLGKPTRFEARDGRF